MAFWTMNAFFSAFLLWLSRLYPNKLMKRHGLEPNFCFLSPFLQNVLKSGGSKRQGKTSFVEHRTFLHLYHSFHRLWIFLIMMFQVNIAHMQICTFIFALKNCLHFDLHLWPVLLDFGVTSIKIFLIKVVLYGVCFVCMVDSLIFWCFFAVFLCFLLSCFLSVCTFWTWFLFLQCMWYVFYLSPIWIPIALSLFLFCFVILSKEAGFKQAD